MRKVKEFKSQDEYEQFIEQFENCYEYDHIPVIIDDGFKLSADLIIDCENVDTALARFVCEFEEYPEIIAWVRHTIFECVDSGVYSDKLDLSGLGVPKDKIREIMKNGSYSWGVEQLDDKLWYIYLNVSGVYREE